MSFKNQPNKLVA